MVQHCKDKQKPVISLTVLMFKQMVFWYWSRWYSTKALSTKFAQKNSYSRGISNIFWNKTSLCCWPHKHSRKSTLWCEFNSFEQHPAYCLRPSGWRRNKRYVGSTIRQSCLQSLYKDMIDDVKKTMSCIGQGEWRQGRERCSGQKVFWNIYRYLLRSYTDFFTFFLTSQQ